MSHEEVFKQLEEIEWALLAAAMKAGDYAFFIASGLSKEAGLLTGNEMAEKLIQIHVHSANPVQKFRETHSYDGALELPIVAQFIENTIGRGKLIKYLRDSINWNVSPAYVHNFIKLLVLSISERDKALRIITTNYDTLIEDSIPPRRDVFVSEEQYRETHDTRPWVLKVHGCIVTNPEETIRITQIDLSQPLESWKQEAIEECLRRKGLIVIGYGATDIHVSRTINEAIQKANNPSYWISKGMPPEEVLRSLSEKNGRFIQMDAKDFFINARMIDQNNNMQDRT